MRILFAWRKYENNAGGVERQSIAIMNEMTKRGHDVFLMSWDRAGAKAYYEMDPRIQWHKLDSGDPDQRADWGLRLKRMKQIRSYIQGIKPDVAIAFMDGVFLSVKLSALGLGLPVIEAERCSTARWDYLSSGRFKNLIFQSLRLAKNITIQLESYRRDYPEFLQKKIVTIPNPVFPATRQDNPGKNTNPKILLSVGRLSYQKNYSVLIEAFASLAKEFPDWNLVIVGEGEEKGMLEKLITSKKLQDRVNLAGVSKSIGEFYTKTDLFCLPSRWEGFPNVLAEALAHGLPSVGFKGCLGVPDLIQNSGNGLLAEGSDDPQSLAAALRQLMSDDHKRREMGKAAAASVRQYAPDKIFDSWENLFKSCALR